MLVKLKALKIWKCYNLANCSNFENNSQKTIYHEYKICYDAGAAREGVISRNLGVTDNFVNFRKICRICSCWVNYGHLSPFGFIRLIMGPSGSLYFHQAHIGFIMAS